MNQTARNLIITGVRADVTNQVVAVATTAFNFQCAIAFGHTAVSLATTETASFATATTKAPRRVPVGSLYLPVAAAVGQNSNQIRVSFQSPLIVYPGQFVAFIIKPVLGTATATETLLLISDLIIIYVRKTNDKTKNGTPGYAEKTAKNVSRGNQDLH